MPGPFRFAMMFPPCSQPAALPLPSSSADVNPPWPASPPGHRRRGRWLVSWLAACALGTLGACDRNDREVSFTSEVTEQELRELEAREATYEASVAAAREARAATREARRSGRSTERLTHHVVLALPETGSEWRAALRRAVGRQLEAEGDISFEVLDAAGDPTTQLLQIDHLLGDPPDVLLLVAVAGRELGPSVDALQQGGTPVVALEHPILDSGPVLTLALDNVAIGQAVADHVLSALELKQREQQLPQLAGRVVVIRGDEAGDTCHLRQQGFAAVLDPHPSVLLVHDAPGFWSTAGAMDRFREAVRLQEQFDVVFAHSDRMAGAARQAAQEFGMQQQLLFIGCGGQGGSQGGLAAVQTGVFGATVQLPDFGEEAASVAVALVRNPSWRPEQPRKELPWVLITGDNVPANIGAGPDLSGPSRPGEGTAASEG